MKLIAIAGCSGAGKTVLARALAERLGACALLTLDAYYHAQADLPPEQRALVNYDHPDALGWPLLETHLRSLLAGHAVEAPVYCFDQHTRATHTERVEPAAIAVVEGILALYHPAVLALAHMKVFVDAAAEVCFERRLFRDVAERGRTGDSVRAQYRESVWPMAVEYVLPSRQRADLVVSGERPVEDSVVAVLQQLFDS